MANRSRPAVPVPCQRTDLWPSTVAGIVCHALYLPIPRVYSTPGGLLSYKAPRGGVLYGGTERGRVLPSAKLPPGGAFLRAAHRGCPRRAERRRTAVPHTHARTRKGRVGFPSRSFTVLSYHKKVCHSMPSYSGGGVSLNSSSSAACMRCVCRHE